jgi:hypothetical protein
LAFGPNNLIFFHPNYLDFFTLFGPSAQITSEESSSRSSPLLYSYDVDINMKSFDLDNKHTITINKFGEHEITKERKRTSNSCSKLFNIHRIGENVKSHRDHTRDHMRDHDRDSQMKLNEVSESNMNSSMSSQCTISNSQSMTISNDSSQQTIILMEPLRNQNASLDYKMADGEMSFSINAEPEK